MFTIQYEAISGGHQMQSFDSKSRSRLLKHLAKFKRPIVAVYEQATVITKAVRTDMAKMAPENLSREARAFVNSHQ